MTDNDKTQEETETTETPVTKAVEKAGEMVIDGVRVIPEIIESVPVSYILAALAVGFILGAGLLLLMDSATDKQMAKAMEPNDEDMIAGND